MRVFIFLFFFCFILLSCGKETMLSKGYHNLTSRYNPYFFANMRMDSIEKAIYDSKKEDYNRILDVSPFPEDTTALKTYDKKSEDCFKKAGIIYNRHEDGDFLDKAFIIIAKSWFMMRKNDQAINTLKYVNTKAKNDEDKSWALIELLKIYVRTKDFKAAEVTSNTLLRKKMNKDLQWKFYIARADLYRKQNNYLETAKSLGSAVKLMPRGEYRGRMFFILGQLYQQSGKQNLAKENYSKVLKNNPPYEIDFYARLYRAQTTDLNGEKDVKKVEKYYKKLLRDEKNKEYEDKIYYEKGLFALRSNDIPKAIKHLRTSIRYSKNPNQKAYSFLKLGELSYNPLKKYEEAKMCYDSALNFLPKTHEDYKNVARRQKNLEEFVKHLTTYKTEDSLQKIAKIQPDSIRNLYIDEKLYWQESKAQDELDSLQRLAEEDKKRKRSGNTEGSSLGEIATDISAKGGTKFYFSNTSAILNGQKEFFKKWGNRPLEDNWRRSVKPVPTTIDSLQTEPPQTNVRIDQAQLRQQTIKKRVEEKRKELIKKLPQTPEEFKASSDKVEVALFELGRIYRLKLQEPQNSIDIFEILLQRFPNTKPEPEVLYSLYLNYKDLGKTSDAEKYKQILITKSPNSSFARMLLNPDYLTEARQNDTKVKELYGNAYNNFKVGNYQEAKTYLDEIFSKYKENLIDDKVSWLKIMVSYKLNPNKVELQADTEDFIKKYPDSSLIPLLNPLLINLKK
ncbi:MAG: hypothetical protein EAZ85_07190 [Bacteroidetes bacterium]|nr:MAG: hypothetical protein EAZ85_07190 [Bacteroidota bacterium]TAG87257.1 MAG: hypothetical protein EAZ20_10970 [Bacteroidota bacterium]